MQNFILVEIQSFFYFCYFPLPSVSLTHNHLKYLLKSGIEKLVKCNVLQVFVPPTHAPYLWYWQYIVVNIDYSSSLEIGTSWN
jgi:hypothetical protein